MSSSAWSRLPSPSSTWPSLDGGAPRRHPKAISSRRARRPFAWRTNARRRGSSPMRPFTHPTGPLIDSRRKILKTTGTGMGPVCIARTRRRNRRPGLIQVHARPVRCPRTEREWKNTAAKVTRWSSIIPVGSALVGELFPANCT